MGAAFCHQERRAYGEKPTDPCAAKNGNPPGPFWDTYGVDFVGSELHGPLSYDLWNVEGEADRWRRRYPPDQWPGKRSSSPPDELLDKEALSPT